MVLLVILLLLLILGVPQLGFHQMGYAPSGVLGIVLIVCLILVLTGRL